MQQRSQIDRQHPVAAIVAAGMMILPLGSIYAFSVFLKPLEGLLGASRSQLATVFGIAAISYTLGMNVGPKLFPRLTLSPYLLLCAIISAAGMALSAVAQSFPVLAFGYGVLFGLGGGLAYVAMQQSINLMGFRRLGLVNGYVVALLPCGAMLAAPAFRWGIDSFGVRQTLGATGVVLLGTGLLAIGLSRAAGMRLSAPSGGASAPAKAGRLDIFVRLFLVFLLAAAAGLMVLSQASGIVSAYGGTVALATLATTGLSGGIAAARLVGGWLIDRFEIPTVMAGGQLAAFVGAGALTLWPSVATSIAALMGIGMGYGIISGATAAAVACYWPKALFGRVAARIYIAWCGAAVTLPVLAAHLYDLTGGYATAFLIAGGANLAAALVALTLPRQAPAAVAA